MLGEWYVLFGCYLFRCYVNFREGMTCHDDSMTLACSIPATSANFVVDLRSCPVDFYYPNLLGVGLPPPWNHFWNDSGVVWGDGFLISNLKTAKGGNCDVWFAAGGCLLSRWKRLATGHFNITNGTFQWLKSRSDSYQVHCIHCSQILRYNGTGKLKPCTLLIPSQTPCRC